MKIPKTLLAALLALVSASAMAEVSCHCFSDRKFVPSAPFLADPYILATARNSLISGATGSSKGDVVKMRMGGSGEADLWFTLYLGPLVGEDPEKLAKAREASPSWAATLKEAKIEAKRAGGAFEAAFAAGDETGMLYALANAAMVNKMGADQKLVEGLRKLGADNAQTALMLLMTEKTPQRAPSLLAEIYGGKKSWGQALNESGILPESAGKVILARFSAPPR